MKLKTLITFLLITCMLTACTGKNNESNQPGTQTSDTPTPSISVNATDTPEPTTMPEPTKEPNITSPITNTPVTDIPAITDAPVTPETPEDIEVGKTDIYYLRKDDTVVAIDIAEYNSREGTIYNLFNVEQTEDDLNFISADIELTNKETDYTNSIYWRLTKVNVDTSTEERFSETGREWVNSWAKNSMSVFSSFYEFDGLKLIFIWDSRSGEWYIYQELPDSDYWVCTQYTEWENDELPPDKILEFLLVDIY